MTAVDLHALPTHPNLGDRSNGIDWFHCATQEEADWLLRNLINREHYQVRECTCKK